MRLQLLFLTLCLFFSILVALNPRVDYQTASFPCESKCASLSTGQCFPTSWAEPARISRNLTQHCHYAVYSLSLGKDVGGLPNITDFWHGKSCSIMFLSAYSNFARAHSLKTFDRVNNWTVILVNEFPEFTTLRRAGKIPKLSPASFLSPHVHYGVYLDSKYNLYTSPVHIVHNWTMRHQPTIITAVGHPVSESVENEIRLINGVRKGSRPTVTENFTQIEEQYRAYNSTGLFQDMLKRKVKQPFLEAGMLFHRVQDLNSQVFLCSWLDQVQRYSDRDQIALPFVAGWYNHQLPYIRPSDYTLIPLDFRNNTQHSTDEPVAYINILDKVYYWKNALRFGEQTYETWHQTVPLPHRRSLRKQE